ncbi:MAG: carbohydrate kinase family protein [Eubacteriales bacterium]|nr:carbohydrate kinase family protein [Eubacteriales bacterium]
MKKKVIAAGLICIDMTPVFADRKVERIEELLVPGNLVEIGEAEVHTGGSVANTGLGMKILGADVSLMGKIGRDAYGSMVMKVLDQYDAGKNMLVTEGESTSYTIVLAIPGIDRIFLHNPGANNTFGAEDVPQEALKDAALFHFGYPSLMKRMYENDGDELVYMMTRVWEAGVATSLDMAAVSEGSEAAKISWRRLLERVLPLVDFFVPSVEELCYMLDPERLAEWKKRAGNKDITEVLDVEKDIRPLADECMRMGAKVLLIKSGAPGIYYRTAKEEVIGQISERLELDAHAWADKEGFELSFVPDVVRSGTGAGDTSIAAFLTAMLEGCSIEECVQLAAATGACCVSAYDALSGLRSFDELRERIRKGWAKRQR